MVRLPGYKAIFLLAFALKKLGHGSLGCVPRARPARPRTERAAPGGEGMRPPGLVHKVWCGGVDRAWACGQRSRGAWHANYSPACRSLLTAMATPQRPGHGTGRVYVARTDSRVQCCCVIGLAPSPPWLPAPSSGGKKQSLLCCGFHLSLLVPVDHETPPPRCTGGVFFSEVTLIIRPFVKRKAKIKKKLWCLRVLPSREGSACVCDVTTTRHAARNAPQKET
jgi:hypothetical protein